MHIITGTNVDLITPYPQKEIKRIFGWMHCYKSITESDDSPKTLEDFLVYMEAYLTMCQSFGIIDKNHITNTKHEAPLVGMVTFEPGSPRNIYAHVATSRKAWGTGLVDEAGRLAMDWAFNTLPSLLRISGSVLDKNYPAKALLRRLGFKREGIIEDAIIQNGEPQNMVHYGLTRRNWQCLKQYPQSSDLVEASSVGLEEEGIKEILTPTVTQPQVDNSLAVG